eukprot:11983555-Alexandrium_andersonii.AAC.1
MEQLLVCQPPGLFSASWPAHQWRGRRSATMSPSKRGVPHAQLLPVCGDHFHLPHIRPKLVHDGAQA